MFPVFFEDNAIGKDFIQCYQNSQEVTKMLKNNLQKDEITMLLKFDISVNTTWK